MPETEARTILNVEPKATEADILEVRTARLSLPGSLTALHKRLTPASHSMSM